jgi:hypothetical protein
MASLDRSRKEEEDKACVTGTPPELMLQEKSSSIAAQH